MDRVVRYKLRILVFSCSFAADLPLHAPPLICTDEVSMAVWLLEVPANHF